MYGFEIDDTKKPNMMFVLAILASATYVTKYIYDNEIVRKKQYLQEALQSAKTAAAVQLEFRKAVSRWQQMVAQYADIVADESTMKAYEDNGIEYVEWVAEKDDRTCGVCKVLDGNIYKIGEAPSKQHWRCRCYLVPVKQD